MNDTAPEPASNIYLVTAPYKGKTTIKDLLKAGRYDWKNNNITDKNFPQEKTGEEQVEIVLVHFNRTVTTKKAETELDKRGLRPANPAELLALGAKYPDLQLKFPIVALGQNWCDLDGDRRVVVLDWDGDERDANLGWIGGDWIGGWRFAAVRK